MDLDTAAVASAAHAYVERTMASAGDPGVAVVVVRRDGTMRCRGFGSDVRGARVTCETPFAIASLTKSVTALAVMQLVSQRRVALDAPISRYLHSFRRGDVHPITIADALQQRSGFSTTDGRTFIARARATTEERIVALERSRLENVPGSAFIYSNANYDVLGAVIEHVSGQTYAAYVNAHVFSPLHIATVATTCEHDVRGFSRVFSVPVAMPAVPQLCADVAAGGLIMNATQYGRYLAAHLDEGRTWSSSVLDAQHWRMLHTAPSTSPYAMGWFVSTWSDGRVEWRHDGWAPTFHTFVTAFPGRDVAIARFADANEVPDGGRSQAGEIALEQIAHGGDPPVPPPMPPDLYLRLAVLAGVIASALQLRRAGGRRAAVRCLLSIAVVTAIIVVVGPNWGWDPRVGFLFSPDLAVLLAAFFAIVLTDVVRLAIFSRMIYCLYKKSSNK